MMEMQMNMMSALLGNQGIGSLPVADFSLNSPAYFPVEQGTEQFQNLLDLVSDISLADGQSPEFGETLEENLGEITDSLTRELIASKNESDISILQQQFNLTGEISPQQNAQVISSLMPKNIGQRVEVPNEMNKTLKELSAPISEIERHVFSQNPMALKKQTDKPSGEAVQYWATALATGEIESVDVMAPKEKAIPQEILSSQEIGKDWVSSEKSLFSSEPVREAPKEFKSIDKVESQSAKLVGVKSVPVQVPISQHTNVSALDSKAEGGELKATPQRAESVVMQKVAQELVPTLEKPQAKVETVKNSSNLKSLENESLAGPGSIKSAVSESKGSVDQFESKSWDSKDFLLREQTKTSKKVEPSQNLSDMTPVSAFVAKEALVGNKSGVSGVDDRLSSHSIGFVAEKVQNLMEQGGGQIRVQMNPNDLGSLEIRVTMRAGGGVDVKVRAEKESTRIAFESSKGDLTSRIQSVTGNSKLEISSLTDMKSAFESVKSLPQNEQVMSSKDLSSLMEFQKSGSVDSVKAESGVRGLDRMSQSSSEFLGQRQSQGQTKDDSRSRAMEQWEEQFRERKSA